MLRKRKPPSETKAQIETTAAPLNGGERKKRRSISGSGWRPRSRRAAPRRSSAPAKQARISAEPQPWSGASMIPKTSSPRVRIISTWPTGSSRRGCGAFDSGTNFWVRRHRRDPDRDVDPEDRPPVDRLHEQTAEQRPAGDADPGDAAPPADRPGPLFRLGEDVGDDRHRDRVQHAAADRLHRPEGDQPAEAGGDAAERRADREESRPSWKVRLRPKRSPIDPDSISRQAITSV